jgi:membrane-associated protease RseP (regulator of RpoE activity)
MTGKRLVAWFIYGILVAGAFAGVWYVIQNNESKEETIFTTYGPVVVFSFINGALPYPIKKLPGLLEHYKHPRMEMQVRFSCLP